MQLFPKRLNEQALNEYVSVEQLRHILDIPSPRHTSFTDRIPFSASDITSGAETELQTAVIGRHEDVDLCNVIKDSTYFHNIKRRVATGDTSAKRSNDLENFVYQNDGGVWENSWVRIPVSSLGSAAKRVLSTDLLIDKQNPEHGLRTDLEKFIIRSEGREILRIPVSYLLKLSLAECIDSIPNIPPAIKGTAEELMSKFLSDNTSPETISFYVIPLQSENGLGCGLANETSIRYLLSHLLIEYANKRFGLESSGQKTVIYLSPHPPVRQKELNEYVSDSFYRELFMSPCLSGWDKGQSKHAYMCLCHQVLSRSQLNAVAKLRDAGIITRNLVILPNVSNISLANNGTHISLGSLKLTKFRKDNHSEFNETQEKYLGDMVIKIVEHFLPLFVGTYTAAPYRLDFADFHPERVMGFLPHELDFTHLRMIWRRWKKKAAVRILGHPVTPFGLKWLDDLLSRVFMVRGDFVRDFRLLDYPVCLMSTSKNSALDGKVGNQKRLKKDLTEMGIIDEQMSLYLFYRLREFSQSGFCGYEGRQYSLFPSFRSEMTHAVNLQCLITALAHKYVLGGRWNHSHIPADPLTESERRQVIFGAAIGIPTFYVYEKTKNLFLKDIIQQTKNVRYSRRYRGYLRVHNHQFCLALLRIIQKDAADLIESFQIDNTMSDLHKRLADPENRSASAFLTKDILNEIGSRNPIKVKAKEFNLAAEKYYRTELNMKLLKEGLEFLRSLRIDNFHPESYPPSQWNSNSFFNDIILKIQNATISLEELEIVLHLVLVGIHNEKTKFKRDIVERKYETNSAPIHRSQHWTDLHREAYR